MKKVFLVLVAVVLFASCETENVTPEQTDLNNVLEFTLVGQSVESSQELIVNNGLTRINSEYFDGYSSSRIYADCSNEFFVKLKLKRNQTVGAVEFKIINRSTEEIQNFMNDNLQLIQFTNYENKAWIWFDEDGKDYIYRLNYDNNNNIHIIDLAHYVDYI